MGALSFGSLCSGIEAVSVAWEGLGFTAAWFAEIEPFPCAVLAHHYPEVPNHGDMMALADRILAGEIAAPDVLVGGTPCQAFSVAGLRGGLSDARGNLTIELVRILDEIDVVRERNKQPPCLLLWENVPGVLNSADNAFGCFLGALAGEDSALEPSGRKWTRAGAVFGHGRRIAWRVLDAQFFGVAQRRERVFVVASAGERDPCEILFERTGMSGDSAAGTAAGEGVAAYIESSFGAYRESRIGATLKACGGVAHGGSETLVFHGGGVRRLTPRECERLQGFPDDYTRIPWRGKAAEKCPDAPRYKAIGNSMAVPVMRWLGERLAGAR